MNNWEFLEQVILKRMDVILSGHVQKKTNEIVEAAELVLKKLSDEDRDTMERFYDELRERELEYEKFIYLGGMQDGIVLLCIFWKHILKDMFYQSESVMENEHGN